MLKRLFSLAMTICLATIGAWADDVTTIDKQTLWTFGNYAGQSTKVYNFGGTGLFLHSSQTASGYTDFSLDTEHIVYTGGTFTGTDVAWSATSVLVAGQTTGSNLLTIGNVDAASDDGSETSLAFNHSTPGKLYVIYGATTEDDGMFYIRQRKSGNTNFTSVYEKQMEGTRFEGPLAVREHRAVSSYPFTMNEAVVSLDEAGTVYMGGSQPYCIYAILFVPKTAILLDFVQIYQDNNTLTLSDTSSKIYYYKRTDDTTGQDANGNFYAITSEPVNSLISWREKNVEIGASGLKPTKSDRPFAIHGLKADDVIRIEFTGDIYYARHSARGSALKGLTTGSFLTSGEAYTVSQQDDDYDYVVFYPTQATVISKISINQELPVDDETATVFYISPNGDDNNRGTLRSNPFKTLKKAQERISSGCTIHIMPGTYQVSNDEYMDKTSDNTWNIVYQLDKDNVQYIGEVDENGKRPVFDFSGVTIENNKRVTGFHVAGTGIVIKNIETIGIPTAPVSGTQSENFRLNGATNCQLINIAAHDGKGIGFYIHRQSAGNQIVDCDAYNNYDDTNSDGGNNDGFGCHVVTGYEGNAFINCRAWNNADDGFDLKNCFSKVTIEGCVAYKNGYDASNISRADGNGFKAGGFGKQPISLPGNGAPVHKVNNCIAADNKAAGFYSNHHLGGLQFEGNREYRNSKGYYMVNRDLLSVDKTIANANDPEMMIDGYGHTLLNNISYKTSQTNIILGIDMDKCTAEGNSFTWDGSSWTHKSYDNSTFVSVDISLLTKERNIDGSLPDDLFNFMKLKDGVVVIDNPTIVSEVFFPDKTEYTVTYPTDAELYYQLPNTSEWIKATPTVADGKNKTVITVTTTGSLQMYLLQGNNASSILTQDVTIKASTLAIEENKTYDFTKLNGKIDSDFIIYDEATSAAVPVADGITLYSPGQYTTKTFNGQFAFSASTNWRLLKAGRLRANNSADSEMMMAILNVQENDMISITYNGDNICYSDKGTAKLNASGALTSKQNYRITQGGNLLLTIPANSGNQTIQKIKIGADEATSGANVVDIDNAVVTLVNDSRKDQKTYQVVFGEKLKFHYMRPGQDAEARSQSYKDEFAENPFTVTVSNNGDFIYWTSRTIDGTVYESAHDTITVNTIAKKPVLTFQNVEDSVSVYRIVFSKGTTLHYSIGGNEEKTYSEKDTLDVKISKTGMLTVYSKNDHVTSDTLSSRVYAPTPAIAVDSVYDFTKLKDVIGADYTLSSFAYGNAITVGDVTLREPGQMVAKTLDIFALTAPSTDADGNVTESSDWRLLDAGRLRAAKSARTKHLAIRGMKKGQRMMLTYSGAAIIYNAAGTAKLEEGVDTLESKKAYELTAGGDLLLTIPADTLSNSDITVVNLNNPKDEKKTVENAKVTLSNDSRKDQKTYQVVFGEKQKFYYMRPGQDAEARSQSYKEEFAEKPFTVTVSNNGDFIYWTTEAIDGSVYESVHDTITVNTIAKKPVLTFLNVEDSVSVYRIVFSKGNTLHYSIGGNEEKTYSEKDTLDVKISKTGMLTVYSKNDFVTSDTASVRAYAPTPSVLHDSIYDFTLLREVIGADYTLTTWGYDNTLEIGGVTLKKPSAMTAKTFEGLALTAPVRNDGNATESNDWRLLNAGRLRASKSENDKYLAIMGIKQGDYLLLNYSGAPVEYLPTGTARLSEGIDTLKSQKAYRIETGGDLLLSIPADTLNCDITSIAMIATETVEPPTIGLKNDTIPNVVRIRVGKSSLGLSVSIRYTTDGSDPKLEHSTESVKSPLDLTFDEDVVVKAVSVSELGQFSDVTTFKLTLPVSQPSASVAYHLSDMIKNDIIECDTIGVSVYNMEYSSTDNLWSDKLRKDFMPLTTTEGKLSVRSGSSSFQLQSDGTSVRLTRALAFHHLGVGDEIAVVYSGNGHLWSAGADEGDAFTINGEPATAGKMIPSGAILKVTKAKYANNYVVVTPSGPVSGKVYVKAIYINHEVPIEAHAPEVTLHEVEETTAIYRFTFDPHETLHYILETDGTEGTKQSAEGFFDLPITTSTKIQTWTTREALVSDTLSMALFAPTPAPVTEGFVDFNEVSEELPADLEVTVDINQPVTVEGETLYKPSMLTAATFNDRFAFSLPTTANKIRIRTNHQLTFAKGEDLQMALLNLKAGDIVAFDYTGTILINNLQNVRHAASTELQQLESGVSYEIQQDGDLLLTVSLVDASVNISRMYIGSQVTASTPAAINFATAAEEFEELTVGAATYVYYQGKSDAQKFLRLTNESFFLPIAGKLSAANSFEMISGGFRTNGRIALHNLAQRDSICIRFNEGVVTYVGHATKGCVVSVRGRQLVSGDTLMTGDVMIVEKVDYLNNYVVLRLDGKGTVSGIFINSDESETVSAPTITDKGSNTVIITSGRSSIGCHVMTCYTTDGSEPTMYNGTLADGDYKSFSVKLLESGMVTIKAVTISETGVSSSVTILTVYADKMVYGPSFLMDEDGNMYDVYDVWGQRVNALVRGKIYIVNGKKVIYK